MNQGLRRIIATLCCALALQLPASVVAADKAIPVAIAASAVKIVKGPALWQVSDKDTTIYLFGTIHFMPRNVEWLQGDVLKALQSSDELVTELDPSEDVRLDELMAKNAYLPEGEILRDKLAPEDRKALEGLLVSLGIPIEQFDRYKPWSAALYLSVTMTLRAGFDPEQGVEEVVEENAKPDAKRSALETFDFQIGLFNALPEDKQLGYLNQVVGSASTMQSDLDAMLLDWLQGDAKALAKLINAEETDPALYRRILIDRNADWAKWIKARMAQPGIVFMAVGAGHLAGKGSVQDQLRKHGLKTKRVH